MKPYTIGLLVIILLSVIPPPGGASDTMILVGTEDVKNSMYGKWLTLIFSEVFRRMGYEFRYDGYPAARASIMSDTGMVDGEISRVFEYQTDHPDLIRVEEVLYHTNFTVFATKPGIRLDGWKSLLNTTYTVDSRLGVNLTERELSQVVPPERLMFVSTAEQGLRKLLLSYTDLYVDVEFSTTEAIRRLKSAGIDGSSIYQAGVMQEIAAYAYLHKKHTDLVPKVAGILKALKEEGIFESYRKTAFDLP